MLDIPEAYRIEKTLHVKTFLKKDLSAVEKKRFQKTFISAVLDSQIAGEAIPSLLNDEYNCQVIMMLRVGLASIKDTAFMAGLLQNEIKPLCILQLNDGRETRLSFAMKRLNRQNPGEVVLDSTFLSPAFSGPIPEELNFSRIKNTSNKLMFYREWMLRALLLFQPYIYRGIPDLPEAKFWYNDAHTNEVSNLLTELKRLRDSAQKAVTNKERVKINTEIAKTLERLGNFHDQ